jgi:membrane associated rhomboid family serine protease
MGSADRDYFHQEKARYQNSRPGIPIVTKSLLIANIAIYILDVFSNYQLREFGAFSINSAIFQGHIWEFITFQFIHASPAHILLNMMGLYYFGPWSERWWGTRKFLIYYLVCGAAGAAFFTLLAMLHLLPGPNMDAPLVGASAGIYALIISTAFLQPNMRVQLLFPPVAMSLSTLAKVVCGIAILMIVGDNFLGWRLFENSGGEAGHLGGAILGFILMKFPGLLSNGRGQPGRPRKIVPFPPQERGPGKLHPRSEYLRQESDEMDRLLDKIHQHGLDSLTQEERDLLAKLSDSARSHE